MQDISVQLDDRAVTCAGGTEVGSFLQARAGRTEPGPLAAMVNNDLVSLSYPLTVNSRISFLSLSSPHGWRVYCRSLCFLVGKAMFDCFPDAHFAVEHAFGSGLYCSFRAPGATDDGIEPGDLARLEKRLRGLVARNIPIERRKISFTDAVRGFEQSGQQEKLNLLKYRNPPRVVIHWCDGFSDLAHGPLAPATGVLSMFGLVHYKGGFVLNLPTQDRPFDLPPFQDQPHLFSVLQEHKKWGRILGVTTVGRLNEIVSSGEVDEFIRTAEALHDKKLARIADQVCSTSDRTRFVLIAGPSCAGKTTFAKRLATHLQVNGMRPVTLSTDDYFVGDERNPRDENGIPDYEHVEAVDLELFNNDLLALAGGSEIKVPRFNFAAKRREYRGDTMKIDRDQIVIIEGIHGLNPLLTHKVPPESKFRVYVNALTQLNVDSNNRISTTDNRLMRRIIRDNRYRGHTALETLQLWPSVLRGEKRWIFPFQREADATFNSALDYELAVIKPIIEPLLMQVKPCDAEYAETRRLTEFLLNFLGAGARGIPNDSILREYIGGSTFRY